MVTQSNDSADTCFPCFSWSTILLGSIPTHREEHVVFAHNLIEIQTLCWYANCEDNFPYKTQTGRETDSVIFNTKTNRCMSIRHTSSSVLAFSAASSIVLSATTASRLVEYFSSCEKKVGGRRWWQGDRGVSYTCVHPFTLHFYLFSMQ